MRKMTAVQNIFKRPLYAASFLILFFTVFDGIFQYLTPLLITSHGISKTLMGLIMGAASFSGMVFDLVLYRVLKNANFRRIYLFMLLLGAAYPLILWQASNVLGFLAAMIVWGIFYDLYNFGNFNFVGRFTDGNAHVKSFGVIRSSISLGYLVAPILVEFALLRYGGFAPFALAWVFLGVSALFFVILLKSADGLDAHVPAGGQAKGLFGPRGRWRHVARLILPLLACTFVLNIIDSSFWTVGPLISESFMDQGYRFGSLFMVLYLLPPLFVGWRVSALTERFGKKKTAFFALLFGSILLTLMAVNLRFGWLLVIVFFASSLLAIAWPALNGAYADYISESIYESKDIESLVDLATNIGFIIGPVMAGFIADSFNNSRTFLFLGILGVAVAWLLLKKTPKSIDINV